MLRIVNIINVLCTETNWEYYRNWTHSIVEMKASFNLFDL